MPMRHHGHVLPSAVTILITILPLKCVSIVKCLQEHASSALSQVLSASNAQWGTINSQSPTPASVNARLALLSPRLPPAFVWLVMSLIAIPAPYRLQAARYALTPSTWWRMGASAWHRAPVDQQSSSMWIMEIRSIA